MRNIFRLIRINVRDSTLGLAWYKFTKRPGEEDFQPFFMFSGLSILGIVIAVVSWNTSLTMLQIGVEEQQPGLLLSFALMITSLFYVMLGIPSLFSRLYLDSDLRRLLPLPFTGGQLLMGKLLATGLSMYGLGLVILYPVLHVYATRSPAGGIQFWLSGLIVFILLPALPLSLAVLLLLPLRRLMRGRSSDAFKKLGSVLSILLYLVYYVYVYRNPHIYDGAVGAAETLAAGIAHASSVFPPVQWAAQAVVEAGGAASLRQLVAFVGVAGLGLLLAWAMAGTIYLVSDGGATDGKQRSARSGRVTGEAATPLRACFLREWRLFPRDPNTFRLLAQQLAMPVMMLVAVLRAGLSAGFIDNSNPAWALTVVLAWILLAPMYSSAGICVSREGKYLYISRYLPLPAAVIVHSKLLHTMVINGISGVILAIAVGVFWQLTVIHIVAAWLLAMLLGTAASCVMILPEITAPVVQWNRVEEAARAHSGLKIGLGIGYVAGFSLILFLVHSSPYGALLLYALLLIIALGATAVAYRALMLCAEERWSRVEL